MVDLKCNATGCPEQPSFIWRTADDKPFKPVKDENGFISFKTEVLTNIQLVCTAKCEDSLRQANMKVVVYCKYILRLENKPINQPELPIF